MLVKGPGKGILLPLLLLPLLWGCGNGKKANQEKQGARTVTRSRGTPSGRTNFDPASVPLADHLAERYQDDLPGLLQRHYIRVLTTFNKTNFFLDGSRIYGFEYSLLKAYEKSLNEKQKGGGLRVVLEFIPVPRDQLIPRLVQGLGDIAAAGLTITPRRSREVAFTDPYLTDVDELVVSNTRVQGLRTLEDLSGRRVYVRRSSSYFESLAALNRRFAEKGIAPVKIMEVDESLETEDILEMVASGALPITIADSNLAGIWARVFDGLRVHTRLKVRTGGKIAWMVRKNNPELRKSLNAFIKHHRKGTLFGNIYFNRYFRNNRWMKNPLGREEDARESRYDRLFRKYADRYGFDWLLIKALAFQESGLDQNKRSASGAVGIMQIRPSTAADRHVGIHNVEDLENNIHAGVKYLAFLRDRYFSDEWIRERDRIRLSLAAYNAGPTKIRRARELAARMNLDPDRWFRNVEMAVLRLIGRETVEYVSNINKYYIIFKLYEETRKLRESGRLSPLKGAGEERPRSRPAR